jgi:hypothetical protein
VILRLSDTELSFYLAAAKRLPLQERPLFEERVTTLLQAHRDPGPGDINRVVRQVLAEWQTSPPQRPAVSGAKWGR